MLAVFGSALATEAYRRWSLHEQAMRQKQELSHAWLLMAMTVVIALAGAIVAILILLVQ